MPIIVHLGSKVTAPFCGMRRPKFQLDRFRWSAGKLSCSCVSNKTPLGCRFMDSMQLRSLISGVDTWGAYGKQL